MDEIQQSTQKEEELRRELDRLREVEQRFEDFADSARDYAFITMDLDNRVVGWNKGAEQLLGYSKNEIMGQSGEVFFTPEDVKSGAAQREIETARLNGRAEDERWHMRKDGSRFWASGVMAALRRKDGELHGFAKVMRDRTEQRQSMEALRASEERFRLLVENVRDCALFSVDQAGFVSEWNPGAERTFGYTTAEILGRSAIETFSADEHARNTLEIDLRNSAAGDGAEAEAWMMRKDGSRFFARWVTNAMRNERGDVTGYAKVLKDETERKLAEEARERQFSRDRERLEGQVHFTNSALDRTKEELQDLAGQLLSAQEAERRSIARDLHDHLAQRLALLDMRVGRLLSAELRDRLDFPAELKNIHDQIAQLSNEVRSLSHRLHPSTLEHIGLKAAVKSMTEEFSNHRSHPVQLDAGDFFEEGLEPELLAVLYRISEEAVRNAVQHAGDVPVKVTLFRSPGAAHLIVEDAGAGFPQHVLQGRRTLGLISMAERARLARGTLDIVSKPGEGTKVEVKVPAVAVDGTGPLKRTTEDAG